MTARLTDAVGNAGANSTATSVTVDAGAPTATVAITAIADDNGTSSSDYVTNDTTLTVSGTHGPLGSGEKCRSAATAAPAGSMSPPARRAPELYRSHAARHELHLPGADRRHRGQCRDNTASQAVTIDTAAPKAPSITSIAENGGGGINAGEASDGTPVVVGLAGTERRRPRR